MTSRTFVFGTLAAAAIAVGSLHAQQSAAQRLNEALYPNVKPTGVLGIPMIQPPPAGEIEVLPIRNMLPRSMGGFGPEIAEEPASQPSRRAQQPARGQQPPRRNAQQQ